MTVAEIVEISSGSIDDREMLNRRISIVNSTPARGALKMPAMAPAAPQPSRTVMLRYDRPQSRPRLLPMAAPVYTIGASAPTDPPNPMVTADVSIDDQVLCGLILDSPRLTANRTLVTP
jgi:hypothetical protein